MVDSIGVKPTIAIDRRVAPIAPTVATAAPAVVAQAGYDTNTVTMPTVAQQLAAEAPIDQDRVTRIKRAIANGTFPIYPSTIADRMLALKMEWNPHDAA